MLQHREDRLAEIDHALIAERVVLVAERDGGNAEPCGERRQPVVADDDEVRLHPLQQIVELVLLAVADGEVLDVAIGLDQMAERVLARILAVVDRIVVEHERAVDLDVEFAQHADHAVGE